MKERNLINPIKKYAPIYLKFLDCLSFNLLFICLWPDKLCSCRVYPFIPLRTEIGLIKLRKITYSILGDLREAYLNFKVKVSVEPIKYTVKRIKNCFVEYNRSIDTIYQTLMVVNYVWKYLKKLSETYLYMVHLGLGPFLLHRFKNKPKLSSSSPWCHKTCNFLYRANNIKQSFITIV